MIRFATILPLLFGSAAYAEQQPFPNWLTGCHLEKKGERWTEECWTAARAGIMLGSGRNGRGDKLIGWEVMRIEREADGLLTFWGSPMGAKPVPFRAISVSANEVIFSNPSHDYPQRIRYWRVGKLLRAATSLSDGSKAMQWTFSGAEPMP